MIVRVGRNAITDTDAELQIRAVVVIPALEDEVDHRFGKRETLERVAGLLFLPGPGVAGVERGAVPRVLILKGPHWGANAIEGKEDA